MDVMKNKESCPSGRGPFWLMIQSFGFVGFHLITLVSSPERRGAVSHSDITAKKQELGPPPSVRLHADSRPHWPDHFGRCLPLPEQLLIELNLLFPASGWANNKLGRRGLTWILDPRPLPWNLRVHPTSDSMAPPTPHPPSDI